MPIYIASRNIDNIPFMPFNHEYLVYIPIGEESNYSAWLTIGAFPSTDPDLPLYGTGSIMTSPNIGDALSLSDDKWSDSYIQYLTDSEPDNDQFGAEFYNLTEVYSASDEYDRWLDLADIAGELSGQFVYKIVDGYAPADATTFGPSVNSNSFASSILRLAALQGISISAFYTDDLTPGYGTLLGTISDDSLNATDQTIAGDGLVALFGGAGGDTLVGGSSSIYLIGGSDDQIDQMIGGSGNTTFVGYYNLNDLGHSDSFHGGSGNDTFVIIDWSTALPGGIPDIVNPPSEPGTSFVHSGEITTPGSVISGGAGLDRLTYEYVGGPVSIQFSTHAISEVEIVTGSAYTDVFSFFGALPAEGVIINPYEYLNGSPTYLDTIDVSGATAPQGLDVTLGPVWSMRIGVIGGTPGDYPIEAYGVDTVIAGDGRDLLRIDNGLSSLPSDPGAIVDLSAGTVEFSTNGNVYGVQNFEHVLGSNSRDTITGNGEANILFGGGGADEIDGGGGDDIIYGDTPASIPETMPGFLGHTPGYDLFHQIYPNGAPAAPEAVDILRGGDGNDIIFFGTGDVIDGGAGFDRGLASFSSAPVEISSADHGVEWLVGSSGNDTLTAATVSTEVSAQKILLTIDTYHYVNTPENYPYWENSAPGYLWRDYEQGYVEINGKTRIIDYSPYTIVEGGDGDDQITSIMNLGDVGRVLLAGGMGDDTYHLSGSHYVPFADLFLASNNYTEIYDLDGTGSIFINGLEISNREYLTPFTEVSYFELNFANNHFFFHANPLEYPYTSPDFYVSNTGASISVQYSDGDLRVIYRDQLDTPDSSDDQLRFLLIRDFEPGDFGITFAEYKNPEKSIGHGTTRTIRTQEFKVGGGDGDDSLTGGDETDALDGGRGNDILDARGGSDLIIPGLGDDIVTTGTGSDRVVFGPEDGNDIVTDFDGLRDRLVLDGQQINPHAPQAGMTIVQSGADVRITYGANSSILLAGVNLDAWKSIVAPLPTIVGTWDDDDIIGTSGSDVISTGEGQHTISAGDGDDWIVYTSGYHTIFGSTSNRGFDTLDLSRFFAADVVFSVSGNDVIVETYEGDLTLTYQAYYSIGNQNANIERIVFADAVLGEQDILNRVITDHVTEGDDIIYGTRRNDTIDGGAGNDTMIGGAGNDYYYVDSPGDVVVELANEGTSDRIFSPLDWTLGDNIERLILTGTAAIYGTGNALGNQIDGNNGANLLSGLDGDDDLRGLGGDDTLDGGNGNDLLDGHIGDDILIGGAGADVFRFRSTKWGTDTIADFNALDGGANEGDVMRFEGLLTGTFAYLGDGAFTGGSDNTEARVEGDRVLVDTDGNGVADITIILTGLTSASQITAEHFQFV
ncbi:calcium-binding protein [Defluviimonas salinarum]|uniref:Calcium-binding protein n=1 Tax=Defluviimonas salinarum TaxID=2992147 RepID=A0ABT3J936_9RHOB|nr:calcium-binding protein [Defluviimonas salinarum]MCW3784203.1 calcium-binding protein [Defluviimonas salinarum]